MNIGAMICGLAVIVIACAFLVFLGAGYLDRGQEKRQNGSDNGIGPAR